MTIAMIGSLLGGIGLFLLGMSLMTEGMQKAAGPALERMLANATRTRWRGLASGILVTSLVQSSSAVTVAAIGFVNAGLLTLGQALWVLFGANVGTTMTGWLVALAGLGFKIETAALPLIGAGMLLHLTGQGRRRGAAGMTLAGFGILFLGIDVLKSGFTGVAGQFALPDAGGLAGVALHVGAGLVLTVLMQSSSAALAVALTAAQGGLLPLEAAAAVVIGSNLGTTVSAIIAAAGATVNARRAAAAHVLFNVLTGAVALLFLPLLLHAIVALRDLLAMDAAPGATLALFHTAFNLLGVILMWPLAARLTAFLERRFRSGEEDLARPRHLDRNLAAVPDLALSALARELERMGSMAGASMREAMLGGPRPALEQSMRVLDALRRSIADFVTALHRGAMGEAGAVKLSRLLRVLYYYSNVAQLAKSMLALGTSVAAAGPHGAAAAAWLAQVAGLCTQALEGDGPDQDRLDALHDELEAGYQELKAGLLREGASGALDMRAMDALLQLCSLARRGMQQIVKARRVLAGNAAPL